MKTTQHSTPELTFDGIGINGPDKYRSRVATFTSSEDMTRSEVAAKYGPLFAAAPELLAALDNLLWYAPYSCEKQTAPWFVNARAAIAHAKGTP